MKDLGDNNLVGQTVNLFIRDFWWIEIMDQLKMGS